MGPRQDNVGSLFIPGFNYSCVPSIVRPVCLRHAAMRPAIREKRALASLPPPTFHNRAGRPSGKTRQGRRNRIVKSIGEWRATRNCATVIHYA